MSAICDESDTRCVRANVQLVNDVRYELNLFAEVVALDAIRGIQEEDDVSRFTMTT